SLVENEFRAERGQEDVGEVVAVGRGSGLRKQGAGVGAVRAVHAVQQALARRRSGFGGGEQIALDLDLVQQPVSEGDQPLPRRGPGAKRRRAADEPFLKGPLALVEQSSKQTGPVAETTK